jgi:hypothetical protein
MSIKSRILNFFTEPSEDDLVETTSSRPEPVITMTIVLTSGREINYNAYSDEDAFEWFQRANDASRGVFDHIGFCIGCPISDATGKFDTSITGIAPGAIDYIAIKAPAELYNSWLATKAEERSAVAEAEQAEQAEQAEYSGVNEDEIRP